MSWSLVKLDSVISFIRGVTFKPDELVEPFTEGSVVVMRTKNVQVTGLSTKDLIAVPKIIMRRNEQQLKCGDLLISSANSWELVGKASYISKLGYEATAGGFISIVRPKMELIHSRYLYHWITSPNTQHKIRYCGRKTTNISNLDVGRFKALEIPLPYPDDPEKSLKEQKRIAAILDKADGIRRKRQQAIQLADDFLRSVFLGMFGDPVTNPKGWEVKTAKEILFIQGGYAFKSTNFVKSGIPVVKIGNANKDGFVTKKFDFVEEDSSGKLKNYELRTGDLLMSLTGTVGKDDYGNITEVNDSYPMYYLNQRVAKIGFDNKLTTRTYLKFYFGLDRIKTELTKNNRGVRQANISNTDIYSLNIPTPDRIYLSKFEEIVVNIEKNIEKMSKSNESTDAFFNCLSQKAFKGEL